MRLSWSPTLAAVPGIRIGLASTNPTVGDIDGNIDQIVAATADAVARGCRLVAFGEMALTGYPVEDLALRASFRAASRAGLTGLAGMLVSAGLGEARVLVGYLGEAPVSDRRDTPMDPPVRPTNAAALLFGGRIVADYRKHHLPNYGVFDEERWFEPGRDGWVADVDGHRIALAICEDLWQDDGPALRSARESDLLLVINASPFEVGKQHARENLCRSQSAALGRPVAYVNLVGGQDELVFDGGAILTDPTGRTWRSEAPFETGICEFELSSRGVIPGAGLCPADEKVEDPDGGPAEVYSALTLATRDYVRKNGIGQVLLGLSGGIDSALVAAIGCDALGAENVFAAAMPSRYSSEHSISDAEDLARRTGLQFRQLPIESVFAAFQALLGLTGLAEENLQARIRGCLLMAVSNAEGQLVLATGNKSEIAVGYSTIYGDAVGGFAPIKDVPKTLVWELARYRNRLADLRGETPPIPPNSIAKAPSAELRPDQTDQDSLPDYGVLDALLAAYVERRAGGAELLAAGFQEDTVRRVLSLTDRAEYKRRQYPPGPKITSLAFGRDRRLPITNRWSEL